jgi:chromosome segregation ATPase
VIHHINKYNHIYSQNITNQKHLTEQQYRIDDLNDTIADYKRENALLKERIKELEKNNSKLQIENENNVKKISKQEKSLNEKNAKINENRKVIKDLNKNIADLVLDNTTLKEINNKWEKDYYELQSKYNYYLSASNQKDKIIDKKETEINILKKEIIKTESDKSLLEQELVRVKNIKWYQKLFNKE